MSRRRCRVRRTNERAALLAVRWWTPDEIENTGEDVYPRDLAEVVRRLTRMFSGG